MVKKKPSAIEPKTDPEPNQIGHHRMEQLPII